MKARRKDNPRNFVLVEELCISGGHEKTHRPKKVEKRILSDDDNVYTIQHGWQSSAAKLILTERIKATEVNIFL